MKRVLFGLACAALLLLGTGLNSASASTISVDPSPTDSFHVGNFFPVFGGFDDPYQFTLTHNADLTYSITPGNLAFAVAVADPSNNVVALTNLVAGILYTLHVAGFSGNAGGYTGTVTFNAVVGTAPIPSSILMFVTALGGLGFTAYRRRRGSDAA